MKIFGYAIALSGCISLLVSCFIYGDPDANWREGTSACIVLGYILIGLARDCAHERVAFLEDMKKWQR